MKCIELQMWEILVPHKMGPNGRKIIPVPYHQEWDQKVRDITGGLTVLKAAKGQWVDESGKVYKEIMIPVRVACTESQMRQIVKMSAQHYRQKAVFVSLLSEKTYIFNTEEFMDNQPQAEEMIGLAFFYTFSQSVSGYSTDLSESGIEYLARQMAASCEYRPIYQSDLDRMEAEQNDDWSKEHGEEISKREPFVISKNTNYELVSAK